VTGNDDWVPYIQKISDIEMALVPAGCFEMGSTEAQIDDAMQRCEELRGAGNCDREWYQDEEPLTKQCFDEPFWIDVYEGPTCSMDLQENGQGMISHGSGSIGRWQLFSAKIAGQDCRQRSSGSTLLEAQMG
jgi:hypothetical protein